MSVPYLLRRNPTAKLAVTIALSLLLVLVIDPYTPLLFIAFALLAGVALGGIGVRTYARAIVPLGIVALGFVWSNAAFATPAPGDTVPAAWGPVRISASGLLFGIGIALRGLAIGIVSVTFIRSTDPTDLVVSLVRDARVPYRIAYAMLAAYRFLPFVAQEYEQIRLAQRVRGLPRTRPLAGIIALFSTALRRATRIAVAMDARGFASATRRTFYRDVPSVSSDVPFAIVSLLVALAVIALSAAAGWLRLWDGRFSA
ncbi:MAG: energy-coupling factor transporter transmembrane protein EcfT [Chloroflexi bacterium]|nr:energy-coupling factor transporter transmembrane protein EcfT [Chloroflexota bacterium]